MGFIPGPPPPDGGAGDVAEAFGELLLGGGGQAGLFAQLPHDLSGFHLPAGCAFPPQPPDLRCCLCDLLPPLLGIPHT